jgi:hypothetical protein
MLSAIAYPRSTTTGIWQGLTAAFGLEATTLMAFIQLRSQYRARKSPNRPVDACCAQSRCVIHLELLRWSAAVTSSATIWVDSSQARSAMGRSIVQNAPAGHGYN